MRDFLNAILAFIGAESLTDQEWDDSTFEAGDTQAYTLSVYNGLKLILESRESVSNQVEKLAAYFEARGLTVSSDYAPTSQIFVGSPL